MGLTLHATFPRKEGFWWTSADAVLGGCARRLLSKACRTRISTAMALLDPILTPCKCAFRAGAALPHSRRGAVDGHIGARRALVADQLGTRVWVRVLIVAGREDRLVS